MYFPDVIESASLNIHMCVFLGVSESIQSLKISKELLSHFLSGYYTFPSWFSNCLILSLLDHIGLFIYFMCIPKTKVVIPCPLAKHRFTAFNWVHLLQPEQRVHREDGLQLVGDWELCDFASASSSPFLSPALQSRLFGRPAGRAATEAAAALVIWCLEPESLNLVNTTVSFTGSLVKV